jgi:hypothetical protein
MIDHDLNPVFDDLVDLRVLCLAGDEQDNCEKTGRKFTQLCPPPLDSLIIDQLRQDCNPSTASLRPLLSRTQVRLVLEVGHYDQVIQETHCALADRTDSEC